MPRTGSGWDEGAAARGRQMLRMQRQATHSLCRRLEADVLPALRQVCESGRKDLHAAVIAKRLHGCLAFQDC